ncbi:uncharacterized protein LOC123008134 [Tribolium madens]|uniref:uncharacterized protein LOC123008134 n=1 Tax=Tribolium madens TaxID=41895 RepID=UPI001CF743CB|nr:uncharacterized protein LOC123008134 [Tribolium madens]
MFFFLIFCLFFTTGAVLHQCPNYKALRKSVSREQDAREDERLKCNFLMTNPKKVINPYKNDIHNYVQSKPFGSICLKCSMCLAVAKEFDTIFRELSNANKGKKQSGIVDEITNSIDSLCSNGFENYDLRKFKQYQIVTDDFSCSTHVRTKMDGKWTEKLREICQIYSNYMDVQYLLNDYLKGIDDIAKYLCSNNGIFRDCSSLNFQNTSINPEQKNSAVLCK